MSSDIGSIEEPPQVPHLLANDADEHDENAVPQMFAQQEEETEFEQVMRDTLRYVAGFKKARKDTAIGGRAGMLMGKANQLYGSQAYDEAILAIKECIQLSPRSEKPWNLLATIYEELGNQIKAMETHFIAAHFDSKNTALWTRLAHYFEGQQQWSGAAYCYTKIINIRPTPELYLVRSSIFLQLSSPLKCAKDYMEIVKLCKHSVSLAMDAISVFAERERYDYIAQTLLEVFDGFRQVVLEHVPLSNFPPDRPQQHIRIMHVDMLFEALLFQKMYTEAVSSTKTAIVTLFVHLLRVPVTDDVRALLTCGTQNVDGNAQGTQNADGNAQGTDDSVQHNSDTQDIRFDAFVAEHGPRLRIAEFSADGIPLTWRTYLGVFRCFDSDTSAAKRHLAYLFDSYKPDFVLLYEHVVEVLTTNEMYQDVHDYIQSILPQIDDPDTVSFYQFHLANALQNLGQMEEALEMYGVVIDEDSKYAHEARIQKAILMSGLDLDAYNAWSQVHIKIPKDLKIHLGSGCTKTARLDLQEIQDYLDVIRTKARVLQNALDCHASAKDMDPLHWDVMYKQLASECAHAYEPWFFMFINSTPFFCKERNKKFVGVVNDRAKYEATEYDLVEKTVSNRHVNDDDLDYVYLNCTFRDWYKMVISLVKANMIADNHVAAAEQIRRCINSNLFMNINRKCHLYLIQYCCYKKAGRLEDAVEALRQIVMICPFRVNSYHLLAQIIPHNRQGLRMLANSNKTRCFKRQLERFTEERDDCHYMIMMLNAYAAMGSRSIQPALQYLQRSVLIREEPLNVLLLGVAWITRGMNRSTEDRHRNIITGIHYILRYYEMQVKTHFAQASYNTGRAFHQIGLYDQAMRFYLRCVCRQPTGTMQTAMARTGIGELDQLCAYQMSLILKRSGSVLLANALLAHFVQA